MREIDAKVKDIRKDIRIEIDGMCAKLIIGAKEVPDIISGYTLNHFAGKAPTLRLDVVGIDVVVNGSAMVRYPELVEEFVLSLDGESNEG